MKHRVPRIMFSINDDDDDETSECMVPGDFVLHLSLAERSPDAYEL